MKSVVDLTTAIKQYFNGKFNNILTDTLTAGQTSLTFTDASITTTSIIDVYVDTFGIVPNSITVTAGQAVLTFDAQANDLSVKLWVRGA